MQRIRSFPLLASSTGYAAGLAIGVGLLLLAVRLNTEALPFPPHADFSDAVTSHWPNTLFFQRSMRAGEFPLWRSLIMSGQPFAANPLNKVWYPPQWLALLLPATLHLNILLWLHLVLAGVGLRAFLLALGLRLEVAALMGATYALTPRLIGAAGAGHLDVVYALAWLPWLFWGIARQPLKLRTRLILIGGISALCFLADVRMGVFIFSLALAFAIYRWRGAALPGAVVAGASGLAFTAVQWLPLLLLAPTLSRAGLTAADAGVSSLQVPELIGLIVPNQGGSHETMMYVGLGILALAGVGLFACGRSGLFWLGSVIAAGGYALGVNGPLWPLLVRLLPPLLWLRVPARAWAVAVFALIVLAGYGLQALTHPAQRARLRYTLPRLSAISLGLGIACALIVFPVRPGTALSTILFLIAFTIFLNRPVPLRLWALLIILDLVLMDVTLIQGRGQADWLERYQPLAETLLAAHAERVYSPSYSLPQQAAAYWNIQTFGGVDPFQFAAYVGVVERATGVHAQGYSVTLPALDGDPAVVNQAAPIDARLLAQWRVSHVVSAFPIQNPDLRLMTQIGDTYVYANRLYQADIVFHEWKGDNALLIHSAELPTGLLASAQDWRPTSGDAADTRYDYVPVPVFIGLAISGISLSAAGMILLKQHHAS